MLRRLRGVTLLELMVVVAVVGILAAIAYPSYTRYVQKSRRVDAQAALVELAQQLERQFTAQNSYTGATLDSGITARVAADYTVTLSAQTAQTYTLQAVPTARQATDPCGTLTFSHTGAKTPVACWN